MKYKVTEKHPFLKKDIIISGMYVRDGVCGWNHEFNDLEISTWINNNWIEEIQEHQFTENQLISFGNLCVNDYIHGHHCIDINESFIKFKSLPER